MLCNVVTNAVLDRGEAEGLVLMPGMDDFVRVVDVVDDVVGEPEEPGVGKAKVPREMVGS